MGEVTPLTLMLPKGSIEGSLGELSNQPILVMRARRRHVWFTMCTSASPPRARRKARTAVRAATRSGGGTATQKFVRILVRELRAKCIVADEIDGDSSELAMKRNASAFWVSIMSLPSASWRAGPCV